MNYIDMTDEELKQEFIKYFGEEKWEEEEELSKLTMLQFFICDKLQIEPVPLIVEDILDDSRFDINNECIIISKKIINNHTESVKALIHETRHLYQLLIVANELDIHPLYEQWKDNLKNPFIIQKEEDINNNDMLLQYMAQPIELDAFAYTKFFFQKYFHKELICFDNEIEAIFDMYIDVYLKNNL